VAHGIYSSGVATTRLASRMRLLSKFRADTEVRRLFPVPFPTVAVVQSDAHTREKDNTTTLALILCVRV